MEMQRRIFPKSKPFLQLAPPENKKARCPVCGASHIFFARMTICARFARRVNDATGARMTNE